jgi:hypothetical protein
MKQDEIEDEAALLSINNHIHRLQVFFNFKKPYPKLSYLLMKRNRKYKKMHRLEITLKYFSIRLERNTIRKELRFTVTLWMNH